MGQEQDWKRFPCYFEFVINEEFFLIPVLCYLLVKEVQVYRQDNNLWSSSLINQSDYFLMLYSKTLLAIMCKGILSWSVMTVT